ncbi:MAG: hypothetical protein ACREJX_05155, partial [Polyangiaceae bacterium]
GSQDFHETVIDLFGVYDAKSTFPFSSLATGHSLLRSEGQGQPLFVATSTAVWESDESKYGVIEGDKKLFATVGGYWACFNLRLDPAEHSPTPLWFCKGMDRELLHEFPDLKPRPGF